MLEDLRKQLDQMNLELIDLIKRRTAIIQQVALVKKEQNLPIFDPEREEELKGKIRSLAEKQGIKGTLLEDILELLIEDSKEEQKRI